MDRNVAASPEAMATSWVEFSRTWFEVASQMNAEWFGFVSERLREDLAFQQQLLSCKSPPDVYEACTRFTQTAVHQYHQEFQRLAEMSQVAMEAPGADRGASRLQ